MWLILCLCALATVSAQSDNLKVNTSQGTIMGIHIEDGDYIAFYGVEYGSVKYGKRFLEAVSPLVWPTDGIATQFAATKGVICAQPTSQGIIGTENCLVLDILTKNLTTPKPVFVWLEGEEYEKTSKITYPFENLVQEGLVVVSVKYRLSIFGFLCLGVPEAPGNIGLKDVLRALKWIQRNIAGFGGDPKNVMLAGHGLGAAMVDLITLSPLSRNLVHKALVLSGSGLAPWAMSYDPIGDAKKVADKLKYTYKTPTELAKLLQSTDFHVLDDALSDLDYFNNPPLFAPCIETSELNGTLINDAPINILRSGNYNDIPYVAGFTDMEGTIRADQSGHKHWDFNVKYNFEKFLPVDLEFKSNTEKVNVSKIIQKFYFGEEINYQDFLKFVGDVLIVVPITRGAIERALTSKSPVRIFEFAFGNGTKSTNSNPKISVSGAKHGELLNYLFDYDLKKNNSIPSFGVSSRVISFAKTGSPQTPKTVDWQPISKTSLHLLYLSGEDSQLPLITYKEEIPGNVNENRIDFWNKIYETHRPPRFMNSATTLLSFGIVIFIAQIIIRFL